MAKQRTKNTVIAEFKALHQQEMEARQQLLEKQLELQSKLAELDSNLADHQAASVTDISEKALSEEASIRLQIAETDGMLTTINEKLARLAFTEETAVLRKEALELAKSEALEKYDQELPVLLEKIAEAKKAYLGLLADYHALKKESRQSVIDIAQKVGRSVDNVDLPNVREIKTYRMTNMQSCGARANSAGERRFEDWRRWQRSYSQTRG
ncbi:hypothetical protein [Metabacillus sp. RGM 3146]|uniref:hypothetical protein n=1 Tax=Metabacillus sp. RGM 3146 TaxID=3401092 RepID=UPI003B9BDAEA